MAENAERGRAERKVPALDGWQPDPSRGENASELAMREERDVAFQRLKLRKIIESAQAFSSKMHSRFHRRCTPIFMKVHTRGAVLWAHAR
ncbi:MAG: hypothetical protein WAN43_10030, partial [Rhodomicrobium sp.]